jgi:hypothetical protein
MRKVAFFLLAVFVLTVMVSAEEPMVNWKSKNLTLSSDTRVGTVVLPAGDYKLKHEMEGTNHILVFKSQAKGKETFRVICGMQPLDQKAARDEQHFRTENGNKVLTSLIFEGDRYTHTF